MLAVNERTESPLTPLPLCCMKKKTMRIEATNQDHTPIAPSCPNHVFPPSLIGPAKLADLAYYSNDRWPTLPVSKISPR